MNEGNALDFCEGMVWSRRLRDNPAAEEIRSNCGTATTVTIPCHCRLAVENAAMADGEMADPLNMDGRE